MYKKLEERSERLMKRKRVELTPEQRRIACLLLAEALRHHGVEVVELCVGKKHYHILARFIPLGTMFTIDRDYRKLVGIAKKHSAREMSEAGIVSRGGVWAVRCKAKPINDRAHQVRVAKYLRDHAKQGAAVLSLIRDRSIPRGRNSVQAQGFQSRGLSGDAPIPTPPPAPPSHSTPRPPNSPR